MNLRSSNIVVRDDLSPRQSPDLPPTQPANTPEPDSQSEQMDQPQRTVDRIIMHTPTTRRQQEKRRREPDADEATYQTMVYLRDYLASTWLRKSPAPFRPSKIVIRRDQVPTMAELREYASLNEVDGTRACQKIFCAPVIWKMVGKSLWEHLKVEALQQQKQEELLQQQLLSEEESLAASESSVTPPPSVVSFSEVVWNNQEGGDRVKPEDAA